MESFGKEIVIANGSSTCVLVLHGYSDTPYEFKHVAESIAALGVDVMVPVLPHHGVDSDEILKASRAGTWQWLEAKVTALKARYTKVILLGQSLGAGAAITIAARGAPVDAIIVASTNEATSKKIRITMGLARAFHATSFPARHEFLQRAGFDPAYVAWKREHFPTISLHVFLDALDDMKQHPVDVARIVVPIMVIHGTKDFATNVRKSSDYLFKNVRSTKKVTIMVERTGHAVFFSPHLEVLMKHVKAFIQDIVDRGNEGGDRHAHPHPQGRSGGNGTVNGADSDPLRALLGGGFERVGNGPVVHPGMQGLDGDLGGNINGPSVVKVPAWVEHPLGKY
ncbi:MAG: alpha/beta fold hydrolase, partial [Candidatus Lokiarchaeota archaeon]|nr:alpha/beta fold hydrolase [Candidatus Lokiarchaeota archaeon]